MDLVTVVIPVSTAVPETESITPVSSQYVLTDGVPSSVYFKTSLQDSTIFNMFNRVELMKVLVFPARIKNEFDLFLQYAQAKTDGATDAEFDSFDNYLGSIGV